MQWEIIFFILGFIQKQSLIRHERIHSGYKPFSCAICGRVFTDSATIRKHMILVHKSDPHDWQGDVISDLKKQGDMWIGDLTAEPKKEPDFRRKADRERHMTDNTVSENTGEQKCERQNSEIRKHESQDSEGNFRADVSNSERSQEGVSNVNTSVSNNLGQNGPNNFNNMVSDTLSQSRNIGLNQNGEEGINSELKKSEFWRDGFTDGQRSSDVWHAGASRQPELVPEYWPAGVVLDASRHGDYYRGDNIPDPRKQIEFWQGQAIPEQKQQNDQIQGQLTTLQNLNYGSQS